MIARTIFKYVLTPTELYYFEKKIMFSFTGTREIDVLNLEKQSGVAKTAQKRTATINPVSCYAIYLSLLHYR